MDTHPLRTSATQPTRRRSWIDRAADHPRACWTAAAASTAAALVLLALMATGSAGPVTDWNGPPMLKPGIPSPTIAAGTPPGGPAAPTVHAPRASQQPTHPTGTAPTQETPMPRHSRTGDAQPPAGRPTDPEPSAAPEPTQAAPQPTATTGPEPDPEPTDGGKPPGRGSGTYDPGTGGRG